MPNFVILHCVVGSEHIRLMLTEGVYTAPVQGALLHRIAVTGLSLSIVIWNIWLNGQLPSWPDTVTSAIPLMWLPATLNSYVYVLPLFDTKLAVTSVVPPFCEPGFAFTAGLFCSVRSDVNTTVALPAAEGLGVIELSVIDGTLWQLLTTHNG